MKMAGPVVKLIALLCVSALLSACSVFQESDSDKAFGLIQSACRIEKDAGSGKYVARSSGKDYSTSWNLTISESDLNEKLDSFESFSRSATQASYLDSKWSKISNALEEIVVFLDRVKQAQVNGELAYLRYTAEEFNTPLGSWQRECVAVASLMNK
jgi:hypothetical protein